MDRPHKGFHTDRSILASIRFWTPIVNGEPRLAFTDGTERMYLLAQ